jgi:hypothetical protein
MGPFQVMNAFRVLPPDATHTMLVSFTPSAGRVVSDLFKFFFLLKQLLKIFWQSFYSRDYLSSSWRNMSASTMKLLPLI